MISIMLPGESYIICAIQSTIPGLDLLGNLAHYSWVGSVLQ